jgi:hypothetical protein
MDSSRHMYGQICRCVLIASASALVLAPVAAFADGARVAQKAKPGEIVLLRNVATRPADRNATAPGMALMVSASPNPQLGNAIQGTGNGEITDQEIDVLTAGIGLGARASGQGNANQRSFNPSLAQNNGGSPAAAANGNATNSLTAGGGASAATGAVVDSTRNISDQITGSLSQIPMVGGGH